MKNSVRCVLFAGGKMEKTGFLDAGDGGMEI